MRPLCSKRVTAAQVHALPVAQRTTFGRHAEDEADPDDDTFSFLALGRARKVCALSALLVRFGVSAVLLFYGCRWIVYTTSLAGRDTFRGLQCHFNV